MALPPLLFVYGTLMRGEHHHTTLHGARYVADASTAPAYTLWLVDYYPALVAEGQTAVRGELYVVPTPLLAALDALEDVPTLYLREQVRLADGARAEAYILPAKRLPEGASLIRAGDFRCIAPARRAPRAG